MVLNAVHDVAVLFAVVGLLIGTWALVRVVRELQPARPLLPAEDRPPAGLGRLVPVGAQVEQETRRGLVAIEIWLATSRRGAGGSGPGAG